MALASSPLPRLLIASALMLTPAAALAAPTPDAAAVKGESMSKDHKDLMAPPATCAAATVQPDKLASDPEEGGQVARTAKPATEIKVIKTSDKASTTLMQSQAAPPPAC